MDMWEGSYFTPTSRWWVGWHTLTDFNHWPTCPENKWFLIGWERWTTENPPNRMESYIVSPNPSAMPQGSNLQPHGHWYRAYDELGNETYAQWIDEALVWTARDAYLKGEGKGHPVGKVSVPKGARAKGDGASTGTHGSQMAKGKMGFPMNQMGKGKGGTPKGRMAKGKGTSESKGKGKHRAKAGQQKGKGKGKRAPMDEERWESAVAHGDTTLSYEDWVAQESS